MPYNTKFKIITTADGSHTILSEEYREHYHSVYGAIGESKHIYIENGLKPAIFNNNVLNILEIGFGTGLNAFLTLIEIINQKASINYTTIEPFPINKSLISKLNYPKKVNDSFLRKEFYKIHNAEWNKMIEILPCFSLFKINKKLQETDLPFNTYDVVYFDPFSPKNQPDLWTSEVFEMIYKVMKNNSTLITYSAKGSVKRILKSSGFVVQNIEGPFGKREITRAIKLKS